MSEIPTVDIYLGRRDQPGTRPYFDYERVKELYGLVNDIIGPEEEDKHVDVVNNYNEDLIAAHIGLHAIVSSKPNYAAKTAHVVASYLEGNTSLQTVKSANKSFGTYLTEYKPRKITIKGVDDVLKEAAYVIATCIKTDSYDPPEVTEHEQGGTGLKRIRTVVTKPKAQLMELNKPVSPHVDLTRRFVELCDLSRDEAAAFMFLLDPKNSAESTHGLKIETADKVRRKIYTSLLDGKNYDLTPREYQRVATLLFPDNPTSLYWQTQNAHNNGISGNMVMQELYAGLSKYAQMLEKISAARAANL